MKRIKKQQSQPPQQSKEQQSRARKEKQLTLEDLASVTGGLELEPCKAEDGCGNKLEIG
ncbi:hypothetical protein [Archangium minus]|uniref:hypothetical protein n=1 Tax=Archangium TaxID=47 RepID=UPI0037BFA5F1